MSKNLPWLNPKRAEALLDALAHRILVIDGAMGTMVQSYRLAEEDYRGERFACGFQECFSHSVLGGGSMLRSDRHHVNSR